MMHLHRDGLVLGLVLSSLFSVASGGVHAQDSDSLSFQTRSIGSPEKFNLELRTGPYEPDVGNGSFDESFGGDSGWMWSLELEYLPYRIPYVGPIGIGTGFGWADYSGDAFSGTIRTDEETSLTLLPIPALAVLIVDVLPREANIPFVFAAKVGIDTVIWSTSTGNRSDASGWSFGFRWGLQGALELDFFEPTAARTLDEEWGINHTRLFFEYYSSRAGSNEESLPVGANTWAAGLGFTF